MRLKTRVLIIVTASLIGLLAMGAFGLYSLRQAMLQERHAQIAQLLLFTEAQLNYFHAQETGGKMSRDEAQGRAIEAIAAQKQGDNYIFIRSLADDSFVYHPVASRMGKKDPGAIMSDGRTTAQSYREALAKSSDGMAFVFTETARPNSTNPKTYAKLNGVLKFAPWGWMPGIGFFVDDIDARFLKESSVYLLVGGVLFALLAGLVFRMRSAILKLLGGEPQDAAQNMKKIANGDLGVEILLEKDDSSSMMASLKLMQMKLINLTSAIQENAQTLAEQVRNFDEVSRSYAESKSDEGLSALNRVVKKLGKTADILGKSIARFKL